MACICAEQVRAHFRQGTTTRWAGCWFQNDIATFFRWAKHFGDDVVATADEHKGIFVQFFASDIAKVVQSCAFDGCATKFNWFQDGNWCKFASSAHLPINVQQGGCYLFGIKLVGNCPLGEFVGVAKFFAKGKVVNLDYHTINQKVKGTAHLTDVFDDLANFLEGTSRLKHKVGKHATIFQKGNKFRLALASKPFGIASGVENYVQVAFGSYLGVKVANCSCCSVTCIFEGIVGVLLVVLC